MERLQIRERIHTACIDAAWRRRVECSLVRTLSCLGQPSPWLVNKLHKHNKWENKEDLRTNVTLHAPFILAGNTRDERKEILNIGSGIVLVEPLVAWVINIVNFNDR